MMHVYQNEASYSTLSNWSQKCYFNFKTLDLNTQSSILIYLFHSTVTSCVQKMTTVIKLNYILPMPTKGKQALIFFSPWWQKFYFNFEALMLIQISGTFWFIKVDFIRLPYLNKIQYFSLFKHTESLKLKLCLTISYFKPSLFSTSYVMVWLWRNKEKKVPQGLSRSDLSCDNLWHNRAWHKILKALRSLVLGSRKVWSMY